MKASKAKQSFSKNLDVNEIIIFLHNLLNKCVSGRFYMSMIIHNLLIISCVDVHLAKQSEEMLKSSSFPA